MLAEKKSFLEETREVTATRERVKQYADKSLLYQKKSQEAAAMLKEHERKARAKALIEAGGLVNISGLLGVDPGTLLGGFLMIADSITDGSPVVSSWKIRGEAALKERAKNKAAKKAGDAPNE